jgi:hypothetical protein
MSKNRLYDIIDENGMEGIGRYYSVYRGMVTQNDDPLGMHRVKVFIPSANEVIMWALPKGQQGSLNSGFKWLTPKIGDIVWITFEDGDPSKPIWEYYGWASNETPIALDGTNVIGFVTPNGNQVTIDDSDGHVDVNINGDIAIYAADSINIISGKEVIVNGGANGGVINIEELTEKLNKLVSEVEELKSKFNSHTHPGVKTGPGVTGVTTQSHNKTFTKFNKSDYEDTNFQH